jgi:putative transposase
MFPAKGTSVDRNFSYRRSLRLPGYDYTRSGPYFITFCVEDRRCHLGNIFDGQMDLGAAGRIVNDAWLDLPRRFPGVVLDVFVVMPNHVHGILRLPGHGVALGTVMRAFKALSTRRIRQAGLRTFAWQSDYWDHVLRLEEDIEAFRNYIRENPRNWEQDEDFVAQHADAR